LTHLSNTSVDPDDGSLTMIELGLDTSSFPLPFNLRLGLEDGAVGEEGGPGDGMSRWSSVESPHADAQNRWTGERGVSEEAGDVRPISALPMFTVLPFPESLLNVHEKAVSLPESSLIRIFPPLVVDSTVVELVIS
jgi:hypothetical protein